MNILVYRICMIATYTILISSYKYRIFYCKFCVVVKLINIICDKSEGE